MRITTLVSALVLFGGTTLVLGCGSGDKQMKETSEATSVEHEYHDHAAAVQGAHGHHHQAGAPAESGGELVTQTTCPVMGGEINKDLYVDVSGKRVYVCCAGCIEPIKMDPETYLNKLEKMGQKAESI